MTGNKAPMTPAEWVAYHRANLAEFRATAFARFMARRFARVAPLPPAPPRKEAA